MNYTLIDHFNSFNSMLRENDYDLSANAQVTYYTILAAFNAARFPTELKLSNRELLARAGLKSVDTVHTCKNVLKNHKLIDFKTQRNTTVYRLLPPNKSRTFSERAANRSRTKAEQSYIGKGSSFSGLEEKEREKENETPRTRKNSEKLSERKRARADLQAKKEEEFDGFSNLPRTYY